jgi:hypothetical protein
MAQCLQGFITAQEAVVEATTAPPVFPAMAAAVVRTAAAPAAGIMSTLHPATDW